MIHCRAVRKAFYMLHFYKHPAPPEPLSGKLMGSLVLLVSLVLTTATFAQPNPAREAESKAAIRAVLEAQAAAWNRADIEGYMDGYDRSPDVAFASGDRVTRGWQTVLDRYKKVTTRARRWGR